MSLEVCVDNKKNIGKSRCNKLPGPPSWMIVTPDTFSLTDANLLTATALKTALQTAIKAAKVSRIYKFPTFSRVERDDLAAAYVKSIHGSRRAHNGRSGFRIFISKSLCAHKAMYSHNYVDEGRVIMGDVFGNILLVKGSDGNYRGQRIGLLNVENLMLAVADDVTETPISLDLADPNELNDAGYLFNAAQVYSELEPLTDVDLTVEVSVDPTELTVTVRNACDGTYIAGLVQADFSILTNAGVAQVPTSFSPTTDGDGNPIYKLTKSTNFVDGTVNLVAAASISLTTYAIESTGAAAFDIA